MDAVTRSPGTCQTRANASQTGSARITLQAFSAKHGQNLPAIKVGEYEAQPLFATCFETTPFLFLQS